MFTSIVVLVLVLKILVHQHEKLGFDFVQPQKAAQLGKATLEPGVLVARHKLAQDAVAHDLKDGAASLPERLLVPNALEHEGGAVAVELELILLCVHKRPQLLLAEVAAYDGRRLVAAQIVGDNVEEILIVHLLVVVFDDIPPELHRMPYVGRSPYVLVSCHNLSIRLSRCFSVPLPLSANYGQHQEICTSRANGKFKDFGVKARQIGDIEL